MTKSYDLDVPEHLHTDNCGICALIEDARRYRWWREHIDEVADDGDGITGVAFCYQVPLHGLDPGMTTPQTSGDLMDAIADRGLP